MILLDVNVLVYAHREDRPQYADINPWLTTMLNSGASFGVPDIVFSGFLRIVTHPGAFDEPTPLEDAVAFAEDVRGAPNHFPLKPGPGHWRLFVDLCRATDARGNRVPDAFLAALAIETGSEWITTDRGFARYRGLRWRHPLD